MTDKICEILKSIREINPLIHCITNPISINQCANAILSLGARPIMAEHPIEVCEITESATSLMLNTGNITDVRMKSIMISLKKASEKKIPVVLDVVGIGCSQLRRKFVFRLLENNVPSVIKGNYSEINALADIKYFSSGVDAEPFINADNITKATTELAKKYKTVILATGEIDIISDGERTVYVKNGVNEMASVSGTGCMLGSVCATFMSVANPMDSAASACAYFGICGELSKTDKGSGSFMVNLMDKISTLDKTEISKYLNMEEIT